MSDPTRRLRAMNAEGLPTVLVVDRIETVCPSVRRIHFHGSGVGEFLDQPRLPHIKLVLPREDGSLGLPPLGSHPREMDPEIRRRVRTYTVRQHDVDAETLAIDFVQHGDGGLAATWASKARPGDVVGAVAGGGWLLDPAPFVLIAADDTGVPAAALMLESLPDGQRGAAFLEVNDIADWQQLRVPQGMELTWLNRNGAPAGTTDLLVDAVAGLELPSPDGLAAFVAAECDVTTRIRNGLRARGALRGQYQAVGYWQRGRNEADYLDSKAKERAAS